MITFKKLFYKNFLSVDNKGITLDLNQHGKTLISGHNGGGKSTFYDALNFALYGKPFRKINKPDVINDINGKELLVELQFSIGSNDYKVIRGMKPNRFEIYVNGNLKDQEARSKDYQNYLEGIIGMNEKTFHQIVILGSSGYEQFMTLTAGARRAVIENLLDIEIFSYMHDVLKTRISNLKKEYSDVSNHLNLLKNNLELKKTHIDELKGHKDSQIDANLEEIDQYEIAIQELRSYNEGVFERIDELKAEIQDKSKIEKRLKNIEDYERKFNHQLDTARKNESFYSSNDQCPTCGQDLDSHFAEDRQKHFNEKIQKLQDGLADLEEKKKKDTERYNEIKVSEKQINELEREIGINENTISNHNYHIQKLQNDNERIRNEKEESIDESELDSLKEEIAQYEEKYRELTDQGNYYSALQGMLKDDKGIKSEIVKSYIPVINNLIKKYLDILDFPIELHFDENFDETLKVRGVEYTYNKFSEGQKLRIDLCLLFTWREISRMKNSASTNLLIFDEIGSNSLDSEGFDAFMKIINETNENTNVYMISHGLDDISDKFDRHIRFNLKKYFTEMEIT